MHTFDLHCELTEIHSSQEGGLRWTQHKSPALSEMLCKQNNSMIIISLIPSFAPVRKPKSHFTQTFRISMQIREEEQRPKELHEVAILFGDRRFFCAFTSSPSLNTINLCGVICRLPHDSICARAMNSRNNRRDCRHMPWMCHFSSHGHWCHPWPIS